MTKKCSNMAKGVREYMEVRACVYPCAVNRAGLTEGLPGHTYGCAVKNCHNGPKNCPRGAAFDRDWALDSNAFYTKFGLGWRIDAASGSSCS